ncbi:hypothetical protein FRB95_005724 [Tulasnella sp. JGI-2019a]|nr:hypothetical protein FRB95_005724 [Tulasnella sp. JGI-2019a]
MTSRPEPHLRSIFSHADNLHRVILHDIEASIVKNDIRLYLQTSFAEIPGRLELPIGRTWARRDEIEVLAGRAETLFIVAATFVRFAGDDEVRNPRQQLDLLLQRSESSLTGPDHTIDELYLQILRKIRSTTGSPYIIERLQLMVGAMVLLHDPIPVPAMERLLGLSTGDGFRALHHLHSVISVPRSSNECPRIHHASFPDFITDPSRCTEIDFCIQSNVHEARLAGRCLELAKFAVESGAQGPELEYASSWWPYYLSRAGSDEGKAINLVEASTSCYLMGWYELIRPRGPSPCPMDADYWAVIICRVRDWVSVAATLALNAGDPQKAVEILDHACGTSITQWEQYRTMLDQLHTSSPDLLSEILALSTQLGPFVHPDGESNPSNNVGSLWLHATKSYHNLLQR